jgi:ABC-type polysaccharide/polyol phosphate transport system ATPase subunit
MTNQESKIEPNKIAIRCEDVNLTFRLLDKQESIKGFFVNRGDRVSLKKIHAVNGVSFELGQSEILGIVGNNGAGKSSLLRLLARIYRPDSGSVEVNGRVSALLELGAGFHPELSGRENVFLNAKILGIPNEIIEERYEAIVKWAGLEDFMDMEIHCFSSGMRARLGFAVAMEMKPDVLLVDEVLSVGDADFRRRCNEKFADFIAAKATIVIVTHQLSLVEERCTKAMWLDHGELRAFGETEDVLGQYSQFLWETEQAAKQGEDGGAAVSVKALSPQERFRPRLLWSSNEIDPGFTLPTSDFTGTAPRRAASSAQRTGSGDMQIARLIMRDRKGVAQTTFAPKGYVRFDLHYTAKKPIENPMFGIQIDARGDNVIAGMNTVIAGHLETGEARDQGMFVIEIESLGLTAGTYSITALAFEVKDGKRIDLDTRPDFAKLEIAGGPMWKIGTLLIDANYYHLSANPPED